MNIFDYATKVNRFLRITRRPSGAFQVQFEGAEVKYGPLLKAEFGLGSTIAEALNDYAARISGRVIVFDAWDEKYRQEYRVPGRKRP